MAYSRKSSTQIGLSKWPVNKETVDNHRSLGYPIFGHTHLTMVFHVGTFGQFKGTLCLTKPQKNSGENHDDARPGGNQIWRLRATEARLGVSWHACFCWAWFLEVNCHPTNSDEGVTCVVFLFKSTWTLTCLPSCKVVVVNDGIAAVVKGGAQHE